MTGAVLVIGGGVGGIQTSLDLVANGFKVYLLDKSSSIGGVMAKLDKTFPTNDCSMCILAPKLVECGRDLNIELITLAEVEKVKGSVGNFEVSILNHPRFIDADKCTGCGDCAKNCPTRAIDEFNEGLDKRTSIYVKYPQAVPRSFLIDKDKCIGCGLCENICLAKAINFKDKPERKEIKVGAIVLIPGFEGFNPEIKNEYGYDRYSNVITSLEYERILSASGPYEGEILRPSDGKMPKKIAWIQCVGSRDCKTSNEYCSSVCCMYATKEAIVSKEHVEDIEPTIFFMDMRAHGKDFERYYQKAQEDYKIRYIRSRIPDIREDPITENLIITYETEEGNLNKEDFELVVLSTGLNPPKESKKLADKIGIELNEYGFVKTGYLSPLETSKKGVFVAGPFQGPKDIPETVVQGSGAASLVSSILRSARKTQIKAKKYPPEKDVSKEPLKIGVFICHCGINIGATVDVPQVVEYTRTLPDVVYVEENLYTCSDDTQVLITEKIKKYDLNRIVVASCTPRTHEPLFKETLRNAGLNPYLFEFVNIREQVSWVHQKQKPEATDKAKELVRMGIAKARFLSPLEPLEVSVIPKALIIGGGVAGMISALEIARKGFEVHLIEKEKKLGGNLNRLNYIPEVNDTQKYVNTLKMQITSEKLIKVHLNSLVEKVDGFVGNFKTIILNHKSGKNSEIEHGVVIVATGAQENKTKDYLYGKNPKIITQTELGKKISEKRIDWIDGKNIVMIQCVGSRDEEHPYCSKFCCTQAMDNINKIFKEKPDANVYVLYRDIRTYGFREQYYNLARENGAFFIRYDDEHMPKVSENGKSLSIVAYDPILKEDLQIPCDLLVLSTGMIPSQTNETISKLLKVPLNEDGFFLEAHVKLRPVDFATEGIFLAGLAHSPKTLDETISQACAAAAHASIPLVQGSVSVEPIISKIDEDKCIGCGLCVSVCSQNAIELTLKEGGRKAETIPASCKGCGTCGASCPQQAITMQHFSDEEITAQIDALAETL